MFRRWPEITHHQDNISPIVTEAGDIQFEVVR